MGSRFPGLKIETWGTQIGTRSGCQRPRRKDKDALRTGHPAAVFSLAPFIGQAELPLSALSYNLQSKNRDLMCVRPCFVNAGVSH